MTKTGDSVTVSYFQLELAFGMVSDSGSDVECYIDPSDGAIYCCDSYGELPDELPEHFDAETFLAIPAARDLDLGQQLIFDFVREHGLDYGHVRSIFRAKGAYARYKDWLCAIGKLDDWHAYEARCTREALARWCADHGLALSD